MRQRARAIAAVTAAMLAAAALTGCGVQSTGVNIAQVTPFGVASPTGAHQTSPSQDGFSVSLYLFSQNKGPGDMIVRPLAKRPVPEDLPGLLSWLSSDERDSQDVTYVPSGITIEPTAQKHWYQIEAPGPLSALALQQLTCTFDQYWLAHPDSDRSIRPTTRFVQPDYGIDTRWQDCPEGVVSVDPGPTVAEPSAASAKASADAAGG